MSEELKVDILLVLYANPRGVRPSDLRQVFLSHHGRPLELAPSALEGLLEEMTADIVERRLVGGRETLVACGATRAQAARSQAHPTRPQAPPTRPQAHPTGAQAHPARPQAHPTGAQAHPARPQAHPARPQAHPARPQAHPTGAQALPTRPQAHPTRPQAHPTGAQALPTRPQAQVGPTQQTSGLPAATKPGRSQPLPSPSAWGARKPVPPLSRIPGGSEQPDAQAERPLTYSQALQRSRCGGGRAPTPCHRGDPSGGREETPDSIKQWTSTRVQATRDGGELEQWLLGVLRRKGYRDGLQLKSLAKLGRLQMGRELSQMAAAAGSLSVREFLQGLPDVELVNAEASDPNIVVRLRPHAKWTLRRRQSVARTPEQSGSDRRSQSSEPGGLGAEETVPREERDQAVAEPPAPASPSQEGGIALGSREQEGAEQLQERLQLLVSQHPGGLSICQLRRAYSRCYGRPLSTLHHASVKELLQSMGDGLRLRGLGVQTRVFPYSAAEAAQDGDRGEETENGDCGMSVQGDEVELSEGAEEDALSASGPHATDGLDGGGPTGSVSDSTDPRTPTPPSSRSPLPGQTARSPPSSKSRPSQHSRSSPSRRGCVTLPPPPCLLAAQEPSRFWPTSVTLGPWAPVAAPPGPGFLSGVGPNPLPGPTAYTRSLAHTPSSGPQTGLGLSPVPRPLAYSASFPHTPSSGPQTRLGLIPVPRPVAYSASFPHTASGGLQTRLGLSPVPRPVAYSASFPHTASGGPQTRLGLSPVPRPAAYSAWFPPTASCGLQTGLGLSPVPRPAAYTSAYPTTPSATPRPGLRIGAPVATQEPPQGPSPDFSDPPSLEGSCSFL